MKRNERKVVVVCRVLMLVDSPVVVIAGNEMYISQAIPRKNGTME